MQNAGSAVAVGVLMILTMVASWAAEEHKRTYPPRRERTKAAQTEPVKPFTGHIKRVYLKWPESS